MPAITIGEGARAVALSVTGLAKSFRTDWGRRVVGLTDVSFEVPAGEIFGLLGPNGAGKSTTLKIVLGLLTPTAGTGTLLGEPLGSVAARARIGFLPENPYFYDYLTPHEFLETCASLSGLPRHGRRDRIRELLDRVGLDPDEKRRLRKFSKGMLQRVGLAQAILADPELVILDEPMSGLDPTGRRQVRDLILDLKKQKKTVLLSSHILPDVEALCDRVGILVKGRLRRVGTVRDLIPHDKGYEVEVTDLPSSLSEAWSREGTGRPSGDAMIITVASQAELQERVGRILASGARLRGVRSLSGSLEEAFLAAVHEGNQDQREAA